MGKHDIFASRMRYIALAQYDISFACGKQYDMFAFGERDIIG